jgi:D-serine deaminase-like pyridoxal phosphate-dependent protein
MFAMDAETAHLAINHLPVVLSLVGAVAALIAFMSRRRSVLLYALATLTLAGLSSYPALFTGRAAAELVEHRWYVDRAQMRLHHETAETANWLALGTGALAMVAWWLVLRSPREARPGTLLMAAVLVAGVGSATAMGWTSWQGGYIVSKNAKLVRSAAPAASPTAAPMPGAPMPAGMHHSGH